MNTPLDMEHKTRALFRTYLHWISLTHIFINSLQTYIHPSTQLQDAQYRKPFTKCMYFDSPCKSADSVFAWCTRGL